MNKIYYTSDGRLVFHDPGPEMIPLLSAMDPNFKIDSIQPQPGFLPKFQKAKKETVTLRKPLFDITHEDLDIPDPPGLDEATSHLTFDALCALALSEISQCRLCGRVCGTNRFLETGACGLRAQTHNAPPFIHTAEEPQINPSAVVNFAGCSLRCLYCIDAAMWDSESLPKTDPRVFWDQMKKLMKTDIPLNSLEFTNPTESIHGILTILKEAPASFRLPVVLNSHLFGTDVFYRIAKYIADVWLIDLRYGCNACGENLSQVEDYMRFAELGLKAICSTDARIIVRILVLPGHVQCCHKPALELLADYKDHVWISILEQFVPEHEAYKDDRLNRRPSSQEIMQVRNLAVQYGLRDIEAARDIFWKGM